MESGIQQQDLRTMDQDIGRSDWDKKSRELRSRDCRNCRFRKRPILTDNLPYLKDLQISTGDLPYLLMPFHYGHAWLVCVDTPKKLGLEQQDLAYMNRKHVGKAEVGL